MAPSCDEPTPVSGDSSKGQLSSVFSVRRELCTPYPDPTRVLRRSVLPLVSSPPPGSHSELGDSARLVDLGSPGPVSVVSQESSLVDRLPLFTRGVGVSVCSWVWSTTFSLTLKRVP